MCLRGLDVADSLYGKLAFLRGSSTNDSSVCSLTLTATLNTGSKFKWGTWEKHISETELFQMSYLNILPFVLFVFVGSSFFVVSIKSVLFCLNFIWMRIKGILFIFCQATFDKVGPITASEKNIPYSFNQLLKQSLKLIQNCFWGSFCICTPGANKWYGLYPTLFLFITFFFIIIFRELEKNSLELCMMALSCELRTIKICSPA